MGALGCKGRVSGWGRHFVLGFFWAFELFSWLSFWETPIQWLTHLGGNVIIIIIIMFRPLVRTLELH